MAAFINRLILFLFLSIPIISFAQSLTILGEVRDSASTQGIEFATVSVINQNGKIAAITTSVKSGKFSLQVNNAGTYLVIVESLGYKKKLFTHVLVGKKTNVGIIVMQPFGNTLQEVIVSGQSSGMKIKNDRQVFNVSQFDNSKGGTAIDLLKNLPSVAVNSLGNVTLRGSDNFLVLINGKPTLVDGNTILSQLPAGSVAHIEVITTPSARFDPDGKAGIINIITKKGTDDGWLFIANATGGLPSIHSYNNSRTPSRYSADITVGYKKDKWDLSANGNYLRNDVAGYREGNAYTVDPGDFTIATQTNFPSVGERSFKRYNYGLRLSAIYTASKNDTWSAGFYEGFKHQDREADLNYHVFRTQASNFRSENYYYNANNQAREGSFTLGNIDYSHTFKDKGSLTASFLYEGADLHGGTTNNNLVSKATNDTIQITRTIYKNPLSGYRAKLDYTRKWGIGTLEAGYQYRFDGQNGNFDYDTLNLITKRLLPDADFTSAVKVTNVIHSIYAQYSVQQTKWYYSGGIRYEYSDRKLWFGDLVQPELTLNDLFPSLQVRYTDSNQWKWKAGISRRVKRTTNTELNPFPEREHSETLEKGDPKLLPEYVTLAEFGTEKVFKTGTWYATAYYQHTANIIQRLNSVYADTILNRIYTNATKAEQYGLETGITLNPTKWWQFLAGINVFESQVSGTIFNGEVTVDNSKVAYTFNTTQTFKLPAKWTLQWSLSYLSLRPTAQGEDGAFVSPNLSIKKTSKSNAWSFQVQWLNMDAGMGISNIQRISTSGKYFYTTTNYILEPDVLQLGISYNFNQKNKKVKLTSSEIGEREF